MPLAYGSWLGCGKTLALLVLLWPGGAWADSVKLIALGDSLTQGYGLPEEDGFVPQLDAWLAENGRADVEVINMGVSGDTTAGGAARVDWALGGGGDAVLVELGGNDMLRGIDPAVARANMDKLVGDLRARGLPVMVSGMRAPGNYGPEYQRDFNAIFPEVAEAHGALYDPFFLEGLVADPGLFQSDGIHPNAEGVSRIVDRIGPRILELLNQIEK